MSVRKPSSGSALASPLHHYDLSRKLELLKISINILCWTRRVFLERKTFTAIFSARHTVTRLATSNHKSNGFSFCLNIWLASEEDEDNSNLHVNTDSLTNLLLRINPELITYSDSTAKLMANHFSIYWSTSLWLDVGNTDSGCCLKERANVSIG